MFCRRCGYDLTGLPSHRCPECGRAFDPSNRRTIAESARRIPKWLDWLAWITPLYAPVALSSIYVTWIVCRVSLGYWPKPMVDDPKYIGSAVDACYFLAIILLCAAPSFLIFHVGVIAIYTYAAIRARREDRLGLALMLGLAAWSGTILLFVADPLRVAEWFAD